MKTLWLVLGLGVMSVFGGEWEVFRQDVAPEVSYRLEGGRLELKAENPYGGVRGKVVVARERMQAVEVQGFPVSVGIGKAELGEGALRLGLEVEWLQEDGSVREKRVYFSPAQGKALPREVGQLGVFDERGYEERQRVKGGGMVVPLSGVETSREDGIVTVVIEDASGRRVRNWVSGQVFRGGLKDVEWDGRDEYGAAVSPGVYRVRGLTHGGIRERFLMQFYNGDEDFADIWGSNHSKMTAVAANGSGVYTAATVTEGGYAVVALSTEGRFVRGLEQVNWRGVDRVALAADEEVLYLVMQGHMFDVQKDMRPRLALARYDLKSGQLMKFEGAKSRFFYEPEVDVEAYQKENTSAFLYHRMIPQKTYVGKIAVWGGKLYVVCVEAEKVLVVDGATAEVEREIALREPMAIAVHEGRVLASSGREVCELDVGTGVFRALWSVPFEPRAMSCSGDWVALLNGEDSTVRCYDWSGREVGQMGEPGGAYAGAWRAKRLVHPVDVAWAADGMLWTVEDRSNPKRVVRWNRAGEIVYEKMGVPGYGAPSCGFDGEDSSRMFASGVEWKIDYEKKTATPVSVLWKGELVWGVLGGALKTELVRAEGREYVVEMGQVLRVSERLEDGALKPVMVVSNVHQLYGNCHRPLEPFLAFMDEEMPGFFENPRNRYAPRRGIFWMDEDGDGEMAKEELQLFPVGKPVGSHWGMTSMGLTLRFPFVDAEGVEKIVTLAPEAKPDGGGVRYDLQRAFAEAKPLQFELPMGCKSIGGVTTANDLRGSVLLATSPWMMHVGAEGTLHWMFPNKWNDVHGSHQAPLHERGMVQGFLFVLGTVPLDDAGDVMAIMGNMGPVFLITSDGLYVDHLFNDARVYSTQDFHNNGGEPFGGTFQWDAKAKRYRMQCGKGGYRLYDVEGLEDVRRFSFEIEVTHEQIELAQQRNPLPQSEEGEKATFLSHVETIDVNRLPQVAEWNQGELGSRVYAAYSERELGVKWRVDDASPWKNGGANWTLLFKTGDSVDLQLSLRGGTSEADRATVGPGDIRLLVAPYEGKSVAVLYRFRADEGETGCNPVGFSSPWRTVQVEDVKRLERATIHVDTFEGGYWVMARIPLEDLGVTAEQLKGNHLGDFGVIFGDRAGTINTSRSYWSNDATGLVNDIPGEIEPQKKKWGVVEFR